MTVQQFKRHAGWDRLGVIWLAALTISLWVTGVAMHTFKRDSAMDLPMWQENMQRWATVSHGALTWLFCIMVGRWIWPHASQVWRRRAQWWQWVLGMTTAGVGFLLSFAGIGLLYGPGTWQETLATTHWWVGLLWPVICGLHAWRRIYKRR